MQTRIMDPSLDILFYIGIIVPTTITIGFFIGFLVCWFQCDLKQKLLEVRNKRRQKANAAVKSPDTDDIASEKLEKASQHSADSAIDVNDLETAVHESNMTSAAIGDKSQNQNLPTCNDDVRGDGNFRPHPLPHNQSSAQVLTEAEIHTSLSRGAYPSHEKLNDEIHSEPRIYECQEDIELAIYNGLAPTHQYHNIRSQQPPIALSSHSYLYKPNPNARREVRRQHPQQAYYHSAPRLLTNKRTSYSSSIGMFEDNHLTDYGFAPWQQRPNSVCAMRAGSISSSAGFGTALSIARPKYAPSNLSWKGHVPDNYSCEILHV